MGSLQLKKNKYHTPRQQLPCQIYNVYSKFPSIPDIRIHYL